MTDFEKSSRTEGLDCSGKPAKLGEKDDMGYVVGYIDEDGVCWESLLERDCVLTYVDFEAAMKLWDGADETLPKLRDIAESVCIDPNNIDAAMKETYDAWRFQTNVINRMFSNRE